MKLLVIGGCGFLGSNLAIYGIQNGYKVTIADNLSRIGSTENLEYLKTIGEFSFVPVDVRNKNDVEELIKEQQFDFIFHLAGQVAMTTSLINPYKDFETNALGTLNLLDSIRKFSPHSSVIYSSTNKVYGDLEQFTYKETDSRYLCHEFPHGFNETITLDFRSPYGCSKGCADQYMLDYARMYDLKTIVFRHSSMYGGRQFSTYDQGWVGWFCKQAMDIKNNTENKPFTISGNGKQVRDILHAEDMVRLYFTAIENISCLSGQAFNIGGSMEQSLSLLELFSLLEKYLDVSLEYTNLPVRVSDQKVFVADITKITHFMDWSPKVSTEEGILKMINWVGRNNA